MSRSNWKGPFLNKKIKKCIKKKISRKVEIVPIFIGFSFDIYNGKNYINLTITENMLNHKFGEFSLTRFKK